MNLSLDILKSWVFFNENKLTINNYNEYIFYEYMQFMNSHIHEVSSFEECPIKSSLQLHDLFMNFIRFKIIQK